LDQISSADDRVRQHEDEAGKMDVVDVDGANSALPVEDFWTFLVSTCQADVRFRSPPLTLGIYYLISYELQPP